MRAGSSAGKLRSTVKFQLRLFNSRRGISPIFAALILLGIVTVLFIPIFIWSTGLTEGTRSFWERSGLIATERIVIEEVNLKGGASNCTIYVRNIGKTLITISEVYIFEGDSGTPYQYLKAKFTTTDPVTNAPIESILQGDLIKIYISNLSPLVSKKDTTYVVKVFTTRGVGDIYQVKA